MGRTAECLEVVWMVLQLTDRILPIETVTIVTGQSQKQQWGSSEGSPIVRTTGPGFTRARLVARGQPLTR
jgi:hypothetical protein